MAKREFLAENVVSNSTTRTISSYSWNVAGQTRETVLGQWMKSEMRDPSALIEADLNEYTRCLAQPGSTRTVMEVYWDAENDGVQNKKLFEEKLEISVLAVGGDFFFGEVPRKQMEQMFPEIGGGLMVGCDEC
jgi:hypothetical protein